MRVLWSMRPGGFLKETLRVYTEDMSTTAGPTSASSQLSSDQFIVIAAAFSSLAFIVIMVVLLSVIYRKDLQCCKLRSYQGPHVDMGAPLQFYSSRQTLVGSPCVEQTQRVDDRNAEAGQLFYVGLPSSYSLPTLDALLPRLPSYESVRKKDRQRQIHMMIANRFGLNGTIENEPPPTYEESIRQSVDLQYHILSPSLDIASPFFTSTDSAHPGRSDTNSAVVPV
ncbi:uncharacterized protein LOC114468799 isoform X2 [Gouania willdenowi]|uniref:uncharacterized protein LOC114468799 isoform X2 n=1 Tax=Gouania willdenowi TaxID=441366 RepID=UPI001054663E|nr:uncharacterized protein LOC114468799 isoform X2 [Gouania willdenowi]